MQQLRFQYKKFWESGDSQETHIGFHETFRKKYFSLCPNGLKLITRLRLDLSHLRFHKFKHNFQDTLNPICNCSTVETTVHYLLHCPNFSNERLTLFNKLQSIGIENILSEADSNISKVLPFGDHSFNDVRNTSVLTASFEYTLPTKRFDVPYIKIYTYLFVYLQFIFSILSWNCSYIYAIHLYFLFLRLLTLDYFVE